MSGSARPSAAPDAAAAAGRRRRALAANLLLASASLALALLALEVGMRWWRHSSGAPSRGYLQYDPLLGWSKRPGFHGVARFDQTWAEVEINSRGLRDVERSLTPARGVARILALGDSFVEASGVRADEGFVARLEERLQREGARVEVINGGTTGYSTDQELLFYRGEGRRYGARVVLLFFYQNDLLPNTRDRIWGRFKPEFVSEGGALVLRGVPVPRARAVEPQPGPPDATGTALGAFVRARLAQGAPRAYDLVARTGLWPPLAPITPPLARRVFERSAPPEIEEGWKRTALLVAALADDVKRDGGRLAVVYVPDRCEVVERSWELTCIRYGWNDAVVDRGQVAARVREMSSALGLAFLDLTPALRRAAGVLTGSPYFNVDIHWNASGHATVAEALDAFLTGTGWLAPGP